MDILKSFFILLLIDLIYVTSAYKRELTLEHLLKVKNANKGKVAKNDNELKSEHQIETMGLINDKYATKQFEKRKEAILEGDMIMKLNSDLYKIASGQKIGSSKKRELLTTAKWPTNFEGGKKIVTIPYVFDGTMESFNNGKKAINDAIADYRELTCVRLVPRTSEKDYVSFVKDKGCWSFVGRTGGKQEISIGEGCQYKGTVLHELLHMLGFFHEHTRPDRDDYIEVNFDNIRKGVEDNFKKYDHSVVSDFDAGYDYFSIMHYNAYAFTNDFNAKTIQSKDDSVKDDELGQRKGLSETDIDQIEAAYCGEQPTTTVTTTTMTTPTTTTMTTPTTTTTTTIGLQTTTTTTEITPATEKPFTISTLVPITTDLPTQPMTLIPGQTTTIETTSQTTPTTVAPTKPGEVTSTKPGETTKEQKTCDLPLPCWPFDFSWSINGFPKECYCKKNSTISDSDIAMKIISGQCKRCHCLNMKSKKTGDAWSDNYLCYKNKIENPKMFISNDNSGTPSNDCLKIGNSNEWKGSELCFESFPYKLSWSDSNQFDYNGKSRCLKIMEPRDWSWKTKYLCS